MVCTFAWNEEIQVMIPCSAYDLSLRILELNQVIDGCGYGHDIWYKKRECKTSSKCCLLDTSFNLFVKYANHINVRKKK